MFGLGATEIIVILVIVLVLFGGKKLPELGKGLGKAITGFKSGLKEGNQELADQSKESPENQKSEDKS